MGFKEWGTPQTYFRRRWDVHHFNVDAAASDRNALIRPSDSAFGMDGETCDPCEADGVAHYIGRYYTVETDGLKAEHYQPGDRVWCNPPYDASIIRWVALGRELAMDAGVLWEYLLPPSVDTRWFHRYLWNEQGSHPRDGVELHFGTGRIAFVHPTDPTKDSPRAGYISAIFHPAEVPS